MISVITGDVIRSKKTEPRMWLQALKKELQKHGESPKQWEIYRGDSFQLEVKDPLQALSVAIRLKAALKRIKTVDVRMAIGIGDKSYHAAHITECNGSAFVFSGEKFEQLQKDKQSLAIRTSWPDFDREMNLYLKLALIAIDSWTVNAAETVQKAMEYPALSQHELGKKIGIKQNAVSTRLKRAYYDELMDLEQAFTQKLKTYLP